MADNFPLVPGSGPNIAASESGGVYTIEVVIASNQSNVPVAGHAKRFDVALTLDTNIYANGDVLAATQEVADVFLNGNPAILYDLRVIDEDDQGTALDLLFLRSNTSIGTENAAYAPTDAMGEEILKKVAILAGDFTDEGNWRAAAKSLVDGIGCVLQPTTGTGLYLAAVCRSGTPTYTAAGIRVQFGVIQMG
jgi:hypothetical protein